ncbi:gas vesicle protein [Roseibacterium sp. SDUM158017]|uniref:gas vesicle protein n=1 Tax=Roseicyclus salinarum TaxID=3036773 RepID=UPI00241534EE|nr:gas vesicle protein [Roseibacterium sp. SDUM158017]MDG4648423.1 gas vesicle protein [Roseibacterium sp. SDUM158017]
MTLQVQSPIHGDSLADVLERILDKGIVIAGDISVSLVGIELLSIRLRLLIATVDKAKELGIDWWENDPRLSSRAGATGTENAELLERIAGLERAMTKMTDLREDLG